MTFRPSESEQLPFGVWSLRSGRFLVLLWGPLAFHVLPAITAPDTGLTLLAGTLDRPGAKLTTGPPPYAAAPLGKTLGIARYLVNLLAHIKRDSLAPYHPSGASRLWAEGCRHEQAMVVTTGAAGVGQWHRCLCPLRLRAAP